MKIVLHAFGQKLSGVMEVPEETGNKFRLAMSQPIVVANFGYSKKDEFNLTNQPIKTVCTFEWTGGTYVQEGHEYDGCREYQLVEIEKTN